MLPETGDGDNISVREGKATSIHQWLHRETKGKGLQRQECVEDVPQDMSGQKGLIEPLSEHSPTREAHDKHGH